MTKRAAPPSGAGFPIVHIRTESRALGQVELLFFPGGKNKGVVMARLRRSRVPLNERASERGPLAAAVVGRREALNLRQVELADLVGCSPRFIHEIEAGKSTLQLNKLLDVLNVLGLHLELRYGSASTVLLGADVGSDLRIDVGTAGAQSSAP